MKKLFIFCCGGLGKEILKLARTINETKKLWNEIFFVDDFSKNDVVNDCKVLDFDYVLNNYDKSISEFSIANGEPYIKEAIYNKLKENDRKIVSLVHPSITLSDYIKIGEGAIICEGTILTDNININQCCLLNINCTVGHDTVIGKFSTISPSVNISGNVIIGEKTYIGTGVSIRDEITIGSGTIIGMGSIVTKDIGDNIIAYGSPCKEIKKNENHKVFN